MNNRAVKIIRTYIRYLECPNKHLRKKAYFQQQSYARWATMELLERIEHGGNPLVITEEFIRQMDDYSCKDLATSFIFSVAKGVGEGIFDLLLREYR